MVNESKRMSLCRSWRALRSSWKLLSVHLGGGSFLNRKCPGHENEIWCQVLEARDFSAPCTYTVSRRCYFLLETPVVCTRTRQQFFASITGIFHTHVLLLYHLTSVSRHALTERGQDFSRVWSRAGLTHYKCFRFIVFFLFPSVACVMRILIRVLPLIYH